VANLYGKQLSREAISRLVGDMSQLCGVEPFSYGEGQARGVRGLEFRTGAGLRFVVLPDRGMDIALGEYAGIPLNWQSGLGPVAPAYYSSHGWEWLRSFHGGLLTTCGLSNVGDPCTDRGAYLPEEHFGAHGRIANLPARAVSHGCRWDGERYLMEARGEVLEAAGQGEKFRLCREVSAEMGGRSLRIADTVTNESWYTVPHMFLYHVNMGFPLLDEGSEVLVSCASLAGYDEASRALEPEAGRFTGPAQSTADPVYLLDLRPGPDGFCHVAFVNRRLGSGLGMFLRFKKEELPYFNLWKRLFSREYVVGLEPGNCTVQGRLRQRERGDLRLLAPQQSVSYGIEIGVLASNGEIDSFARDKGLAAL
jgi:hypothetical protein